MDFQEIIDKERDMLLTAEQKYGNHFTACMDFVMLMQDFLKEIKPDAFIFSLFLSQIRKHIILSLLSTLRNHHIQAMLVLRQVFEAGAKGAYAIAFPDEGKFFQKDAKGILFEPKGLTKECYDWLEKNYPTGTIPLKNLKNTINKSCAHANGIYAFQNLIGLDEKRIGIDFSFFDKEDIDKTKVDLWFIGNVAMGIMDLFYGVNTGRNLLTFSPDFVVRLKRYEKNAGEVKKELMSKERFKRYLVN